MKPILGSTSPRRLLVVLLALALTASAMGGNEDLPTSERATLTANPDRESTATPVKQPAPDPEDLPVEKLDRARKSKTVRDVFASQNWAPEVPLAASAVRIEASPPPLPSAPPLPFRYLGRLIDGDQAAVFLGKGEQNYSARAGDKVDANYRVDSITDSVVTMTYLPLEAKQVLVIPPLP